MSEEIKIIELKELDNALDLLMDFNREIKIYKTEEEMKQTSEKIFEAWQSYRHCSRRKIDCLF